MVSATDMSEKENKKEKKSGKKSKKRISMAMTADKYDCYQKSVQEPEADVEFFNRIFREQFNETAHILREDFCGTGWVSCTWVGDHPDNRAYGYDIDMEPVEWGLANNAKDLNEEQMSRLSMVEGNALDILEPKADIVTGLNFSYFLFKDRDSLRDYFKAAYENVKDRGMFVLDIMGGPDAMTEGDEEKDVEGDDDFVYVWDQIRHDPITNGIRSTISFRFKDGSALEDCFVYDWRLWTIPEVRELLAEAGFKTTAVYWEGTDEDTEEGDGNFEKTESAETCDCWIAYVVGYK